MLIFLVNTTLRSIETHIHSLYKNSEKKKKTDKP